MIVIGIVDSVVSEYRMAICKLVNANILTPRALCAHDDIDIRNCTLIKLQTTI